MPDAGPPASVLKACSSTAAIVRSGGTCSQAGHIEQIRISLLLFSSQCTAVQPQIHGYAGCTQANKVNALSQGRTHSASAFVVILRRKIPFSSTVFGLHPQPRQLQTGCTSHRLPAAVPSKAPDPRAAVPEASWLWPCAAGGAEPAPPSVLPNAPGGCRTPHSSRFCNGKEKPRGWDYPLPAPVAARLVTALWKEMEMEIQSKLLHGGWCSHLFVMLFLRSKIIFFCFASF